MPQILIADKTTLDSVNTKVGATGDAANASGSIFARLAEILTNRLTAARAAFLDVAISSRAPASTALSTATWTAARASYLDQIPTINTKAGIKSLQRGLAAVSGSSSIDITIATVDTTKTVVSLLSSGNVGTGYIFSLQLLNATTLRIVISPSSFSAGNLSWQVIEYNG